MLPRLAAATIEKDIWSPGATSLLPIFRMLHLFFWWLHMVAQILGCGGLFVRLTETAFWLTEAAFCFAIEVKYTIVGTESTQLELSKNLVESSSFSFPMSAPSGFFWDFSLQRPSWTAAMATRPGRGVILQRCRPEVIALLKVGNLYPAPIAV